jgi:hypothetical protein
VPDWKVNTHVELPADDILAALGKSKHNGSWRTDDVNTLINDARYLSLLHVRGRTRLYEQGKPVYRDLDGHYLSISRVTNAKTDHLVSFYIAPGAWYDEYVKYGNIQLTYLDPQVFALYAQNQGYDQAIAFSLHSEWRIRAEKRTYIEGFTLRQVLEGARIAIDRTHDKRFAGRIEAAMKRTVDAGRATAIRCEHPLKKKTRGWLDRWLDATWTMLPSDAVVAEFERWLHPDDAAFRLEHPTQTFVSGLPGSGEIGDGSVVPPSGGNTTATCEKQGQARDVRSSRACVRIRPI